MKVIEQVLRDHRKDLIKQNKSLKAESARLRDIIGKYEWTLCASFHECKLKLTGCDYPNCSLQTRFIAQQALKANNRTTE